MLNRAIVMGRFTKDPELRFTQNQTPVANFTIACERDSREQTDFIDCVAWKASAEFVSKYFHKGSMAIVTGKLQIRTWEDRDGKKHTAPEILAESIYFGEAKRDG